MLERFLTVREMAVSFYKKYEAVIHFALKLLMGIIALSAINTIGGYRSEFAPLFESQLSIPFVLFLAVLFAVSPPTVANFIIVAVLLVQTSASLVTMVFIGVLLSLILIFYCRIAPERCFLILATVIGFALRIPYAVVIFAGLYLGLSSIIPITIGVFTYSFIPFFLNLASVQRNADRLDLVQLPATALDTYKSIFEAFTGDFSWVFTAFVFAIVIVTVHSISRLFTDYCAEIAIATGAFVNIIGLICASALARIHQNIFAVIILTVVSAALVELLHLFDVVLDYERAERVQFEDNDNYYFVKIVPKIRPLAEEEPAEKPIRHLPETFRRRAPDPSGDTDSGTDHNKDYTKKYGGVNNTGRT